MSAENGAPEVRNLKQMLQYQEKAVVSRMLVKNPAGNVTLFAFEGNEGLSEHTAPYDALIVGVKLFGRSTQFYQLFKTRAAAVAA